MATILKDFYMQKDGITLEHVSLYKDGDEVGIKLKTDGVVFTGKYSLSYYKENLRSFKVIAKSIGAEIIENEEAYDV